jgi:hypothetical protein
MEQRLMCMAAWLLQRFRFLMIWDVLRLCSMREKQFAARQQPHRKADAKTGNVDEGKHHSPPSDATHTLSYSSFILQEHYK